MNSRQLEQLLKSAWVPERPAEYWESFPRKVMDEIGQVRSRAEGEIRNPKSEIRNKFEKQERSKAEAGTLAGFRNGLLCGMAALRSRPALVFGVAIMCVALGFALGFRQARHSTGADAQLAEVSKYFREIAALFPNQLEAIVLDDAGAHMVLADQPNVPASPPVYVKICGPKGCERFVTFSGQRIRVNGDVFEVLVDRLGDVLVVGPQWVCSSSEKAAQTGSYRIEARPLPTHG